jgi:hypothetical protein
MVNRNYFTIGLAYLAFVVGGISLVSHRNHPPAVSVFSRDPTNVIVSDDDRNLVYAEVLQGEQRLATYDLSGGSGVYQLNLLDVRDRDNLPPLGEVKIIAYDEMGEKGEGIITIPGFRM